MAAVDVSHRGRIPLGNLAPLGSHLGALGKAIPQQHGQLSGREAHAGRGGGGPPVEAAPGEAFGAEPESLAVVDQDFQRRAPTVAEDLDRTAERILAQRLATDGGETINAFATLNRFQRDKDATLRSELQH